jgi:hypothetical protein
MNIKSYERRFAAAIQAQSCKGACNTLDFLDFILILKRMIVLREMITLRHNSGRKIQMRHFKTISLEAGN